MKFKILITPFLATLACCILPLNAAQAQYCTVGPSSPSDSNVEFISLTGESSTMTYTGCIGTQGPVGFQNLTATVGTDLQVAGTYTIDITWGHCDVDAYAGFGKMWIDFDDNNTFDTYEELVAEPIAANNQPLVGSYTFTVPANAALGLTRMKVMQRENGTATSTQPCNNFTWGSNADFFIDILPCTAGPTFSSITATSCQFYEAPSGAFLHASGVYTDTIPNAIGCDSIITINLSTTNTFSTIDTTVCGSYTVPSGAYTVSQSGSFNDTLLNAAGCDSVITINVTNSNSFADINVEICNVYAAPSGTQYDVSGIYTDTIVNNVGCDSIITIDLTVNYDKSITVFASTCNPPYISNSGVSYTSSGFYTESFLTSKQCDSTVFIDLVISNGNNTTINIEACDEWTSESGQLYTVSGVYDEVFTGVSGCDSTRTYNVNINTINTTATFVSALTMEAAETGATYQWVDCNNNNAPMAGPTANNKIFIADFNGDYACEVTKNGCTELTNCIRISSLSIEDNATIFNVYPNPSDGLFIVELPEVTANTFVSIANVAGQILYISSINESVSNIDLSSVEAGMYIISVSNDYGTAQKSVVIQ